MCELFNAFTVLATLAEAMRDNAGQHTVGRYKETIKSYVSAQFDDIIEEARSELAEAGEETTGDSVEEMQRLKSAMSSVLDKQLDSMAGNGFGLA